MNTLKTDVLCLRTNAVRYWLHTLIWGSRAPLALLLFVMLINSSSSFAQGAITGVVKDSETSDPLPGVNVLKKGTSQGTVTDMNGAFQITAAPEDILVFSFIGYTSQEIVVGSQSSINVSFAADVTSLQEVVVTGYTEQRKRDITGAVTVVDADALKTNKSANFGQMLAGRAAGVTTSNSGEPGSGVNIRIRGISSFSGSDPLIIIDGVQIQGDKQLNGLNPNDIESMQVLKDAAAASIYGSRASAGVIIITTKRGRAGKINVTYDAYVGSQQAVDGYNSFLMKDPLEYATYQVQKNPSTAPFYNNNVTIPEYFYPTNADGSPLTGGVDESKYFPPSTTSAGYPIFKSNAQGTDWWDETFRSALIMDHNLGISGGTDNATYSASVDYYKQEGTMIYTGLDRFSARINSSFTAGKFKFGEAISFARTTGVGMPGGNQNEQNNMTQILKLNSIVPVYDIGGNFAGAKTVGFSNGTSPVANAWRNKDNKYENSRLLASFSGEFAFTNWLKARTNFAFDFNNNFAPNFSYPRFEVREVNATSTYSENWFRTFNWTFTNLLEANKSFGKHNIKAFAGIEANKSQNRTIGGSLINYVSFDERHRYLNQALGTFNTISSTQAVNTLYSLFGKLDYEFNDKFLVSATFRRDGSSNFVQSKYGTFPAFSVGYRISEESFMQNVSWLSDLKIRGGWGKMGNSSLPGNVRYNTYDQYGARTPFDASYDISGANSSAAAGLARTAIGNQATTWETNTTSNIGFDAQILDGKFSVVFDVYQKEVTDLLFNAPLPGSAGNAAQPVSNVASMTNKGYDLALGYRGNIAQNLGLTLDLNLSHYKNVINTLDGSASFVFPGGVDKRFGEVNAWMVGEPIASYYGYQLEGIFQSQSDVDAANAADGDPATDYQAGIKVGRFKWKDISGDGKITDADKGAIGNPHPKMTMGFNIGLNYKKFDFNMFLFGSFGNKIYNYNKLFTIFGQFASNVDRRLLTDSWSPDNTGGTLPLIDVNDTFSNTSSSFYVEDGSYVRATNVTLGYSLPAIPKLGLRKLRLYVQGQNLFTISDYSGIDPALSSVNVGNGQQNDGWAGFDFGNYPSSRSYMVGLNASF
ncbi:MAG TPA: TonB-dependent receptor [Chryseolinea sp.]|nr:TonB-dependent receptor [Chryseolinea sp.]